MRLKDVDAIDLYHSWIYDSNNFECFIKTGPFVTLKHYEDFELIDNKDSDRYIYDEILRIIKQFNISETIFILDLPDSIGIEIGTILNNEEAIKPILIFNFLLHDFGLVGSKDFVNSLITCGLRLNNIEPKGYILILDYNRFRDFSEEQYLNGFNNQYEISDEDVPDLDMLLKLNYKTVVYISIDSVKEDIKYYLQYLTEGDIEIIKYRLKRD